MYVSSTVPIDKATMSAPGVVRILIIEAKAAATPWLEASLAGLSDFDHELTHTSWLADALGVLERQDFDLVLLELDLPDSKGLATFEQLHRRAPKVPVVVLAGPGNESAALAAVERGARNYVVARQMPQAALGRSVRFAVERECLDRELNRRTRELAQSEERFHLAVSGSDAGLWDWNLLTGDIFLSPRYKRLLGYEDGEFPSQLAAVRNATHADDRVRVAAGIKAHLEHRTPYDAEYRMVLKSGEHRWFHARGQALWDATGKPHRMVGWILDVTERRRVEEEQRRLEAQLRQSQKMEAVGQLSGGIAHDFNNILTGILAYAAVAGEELAPGHPARESVSQIELAARRAVALVRRILTFSRNQPFDRQPMKLRPVVTEVAALLRASLPAMIAIKTELAEDAPVVMADANQIHQALMNLATNAAHAMAAQSTGELAIRLDAVVLEEGHPLPAPELKAGRYARLTVRDTGSGMDQATLERIFEPFFTTKPQSEGTGLGLAVVHGIMKNHQGAVTVSSRPGEGATFQIYLPAVRIAARESERVPVMPHRGNGENILYVDDEEVLVFLSKRMLTRLGYQVTGFTHPAAALEAFTARPHDFQVLVSDCSMPQMSGFDLAAAVLKIQPSLPVILASGCIRQQDVETAARIGIRHLLLKPATVTELGARLHEVLSDPGPSPKPAT